VFFQNGKKHPNFQKKMEIFIKNRKKNHFLQKKQITGFVRNSILSPRRPNPAFQAMAQAPLVKVPNLNNCNHHQKQNNGQSNS